ncbi:MAG TPA: hypothetical protein VMS31_07250 [Pyrinomonadaceae bacterium]|nr:hypothetical protein [Pyrinomonadaceae bacterium]
MWRYLFAGFLIVMGLIELLLALHKPLRDELLKNSPVKAGLGSPSSLIFAAASAFVIALLMIFYPRFL